MKYLRFEGECLMLASKDDHGEAQVHICGQPDDDWAVYAARFFSNKGTFVNGFEIGKRYEITVREVGE